MTPTIADAARAYVKAWRLADESDCWCRDLQYSRQCGTWLWLDVEAAALAYDAAVAWTYSGSRPRGRDAREVPLS